MEPFCDPVIEGALLVIAPHMDDDVIGCGGLLSLHLHRSRTATVCYVTDGDRRRRDQTAAALDALGGVAFHELRLSASFRPDIESRQVFAALLRDLEPAEVLVPYRRDRHRDHWNTTLLVRDALAMAPWCAAIAEYETFTPLGEANTWIDISTVADRKWHALSQYQEQQRLYRIVDVARNLNAFRGLTTFRRRVRFAEAFRRMASATYVEEVTALELRSTARTRTLDAETPEGADSVPVSERVGHS